jgi:predicted nucleotidyltransferase
MNKLDKILKRERIVPKWIFLFGSHLYGTNIIGSDYDYVIVSDSVSDEKHIETTEIDIHIYSESKFRDLLENHDIQTLECYFQMDDELRGYLDFKLDKWKLRKTVSSIANNSYVKCKKKLIDGEIYIGLKSLFHSIRILDLGIQIAKNQQIDFTSKCDEYVKIMEIGDDWDKINTIYKPIIKKLSGDFRQLCPKPKETK